MFALNIIISTLVIILGLGIIIYSAVINVDNDDEYMDPSSLYYDYAITIDAGSSHSAVFLYDWSSLKLRGTGLVEQLGASCEVSPGISSYGDNPEGAFKSIENCLNEVISHIPESKMSAPTMLSLGATAGMRVLNITEPEKTTAVFSALEKSMKKMTSEVKNIEMDVGQVAIIPGTTEGSDAWTTVNYLTKFILPLSGRQKTVGILDMGGASAQIAFEMRPSEPKVEASRRRRAATTIPEKPDTRLRLYGRNYDLLSYSNLCYGSDQINLRIHYTLIVKYLAATGLSDGVHTITNPCMPEGSQSTHNASYFRSACLIRTKATPGVYGSYTFVGSKDANKAQTCAKLIQDIIDPEMCALSFTICPRAMSSPPPASMDFYAMSNYYHASRALKTVYTSKRSDVRVGKSVFLQDTLEYCDLSLTQIEALLVKYPSVSPKIKFAQQLCYKMLAVYYTLDILHRFEEPQFKNMIFKADINGAEVGWSLGYTLNLTNTLPGLDLNPAIGSMSITIITSMVACIVLLALINCSIHCYCAHKRKQYSSV